MSDAEQEMTLSFLVYDETWAESLGHAKGFYVGLENGDEVIGPFPSVEEARKALIEWARLLRVELGVGADDMRFDFVEEQDA